MRKGRVRRPRTSSQPSNGESLPPSSGKTPASIRAIRSRRPQTTPATTSLWPPRYFEAECTTRSTPCASGCWKIGLAQELSAIEIAPCALCRGRKAREILGLEHHAGRAFEIEHLRAGQGLLDRARIAAVDEVDPDVEARQQA